MTEFGVRNHLYLFATGALFRGPVRDNQPHRHHALQLVAGPRPFRIRIEASEIETRCILIAPDVEHALEGGDSRQSLLLLERESTAAETLMERYLKSRSHYQPESSAFETVCSGLDSDFDSDREGELTAASCAQAAGHRRKLLSKLFAVSTDERGSNRDPRIRRLCEHIARTEDFRVSLEEAAEVAGLSPGRLTHLFKQEVGLPLRRYSAWLRIRRAVASVATGESLTTAAHSAGFADQAHFSRSFRDLFGLSPREALSASRSVRVALCEDGVA